MQKRKLLLKIRERDADVSSGKSNEGLSSG
jgi:hypothetical protein